MLNMDERWLWTDNCLIPIWIGSGDIEAILALGSKKCKSKADDADGSGDEEDLNGADALAASLETCDMDGMDEKLASCLQVQDTRLQTLEQAVLSGEGKKTNKSSTIHISRLSSRSHFLGGGLEDQITLVLVKKGVIDCENDTQCADDRACIESYVEPGRDLCELPCERYLWKKM